MESTYKLYHGGLYRDLHGYTYVLSYSLRYVRKNKTQSVTRHMCLYISIVKSLCIIFIQNNCPCILCFSEWEGNRKIYFEVQTRQLGIYWAFLIHSDLARHDRKKWAKINTNFLYLNNGKYITIRIFILT